MPGPALPECSLCESVLAKRAEEEENRKTLLETLTNALRERFSGRPSATLKESEEKPIMQCFATVSSVEQPQPFSSLKGFLSRQRHFLRKSRSPQRRVLGIPANENESSESSTTTKPCVSPTIECG